MGSYLTVVNNTTDVWQCKVGIDEKGFVIGMLIGSVISSAFFTIAALVSLVPVFGLFGGGVVVTATAAIPTAFGRSIDVTEKLNNVLGSVAFFARGTATMATSELRKHGFIDILPGERHRFGKMSLSLWRQSKCIRIILVDETTLYVDTLIMRPLFSGATANSNRDYDIDSFLHRDDLITRSVVAAKDPNVRTPEVNSIHPSNETPPAVNLTGPGIPAMNSTNPDIDVATRANNMTSPGIPAINLTNPDIDVATPVDNLTSPDIPAINLTTPAMDLTTSVVNSTSTYVPAVNMTTPAI